MPITALTTYTLQTTELPCGKMTVKLHSEYANLAIPSFPTLMMGRFSEGVDTVKGGDMELEEVQLEYIDDYTNYQSGFWHKVLAGECELQFLLNDGKGDKHFFWGRIQPLSSELDEHDLSTWNVERTGVLRCTTLLVKMDDITIAELYVEVQSNATSKVANDINFWHATVQAGSLPGNLNSVTAVSIKLVDVIASMLALTHNQAFDSTDVSVSSPNTQPFKFGVRYAASASGTMITDPTDFGFEDLWILLEISLPSPVNADFEVSLFNDETQMLESWGARFTSALDVLRAICKTFCLIPRYYYDTSDSRHKIELMARGEPDASLVTFPDVATDSRVFMNLDEVKVCAAHRQQFARVVKTPTAREPLRPLSEQPDIDVALEFFPTRGLGRALGPYWVDAEDNSPALGERLYVDTTVSTVTGLHRIGDGRYYDAVQHAYDDRTAEIFFPRMAARYLFNRLAGEKRGFYRTYPTMKVNNGTTIERANVKLMMKTQIDDGESTRTYYASEKNREPKTDELGIKWVEV